MKFNPPFPEGHMSHILKSKGWQESDILEIRELLVEEIKRQNKEDNDVK